MTDYNVHPVAALFPMLDDDALQELAEDIRARGLLQPVVLDPDGQVLDGRNRLAACRLAGVEPTTTTYDGDDPAGYALAVNVQRRNLRPGQRYLITEQARRLTGVIQNRISEVPQPRLAEAGVVLDYAPDLAESVMAGGMSLESAAEQARQRKRAAAETKAKRDRLAKVASDLLSLVDEERMDLDEAVAAYESREARKRAEAEAEAERKRAEAEAERQRGLAVMAEEQRRRQEEAAEEDRRRTVATQLLCQHVVAVAQTLGQDVHTYYDPQRALPGRAVTQTTIADAIAALQEMESYWKERSMA